MLGVKNYDTDYIDACRGRVADTLDTLDAAREGLPEAVAERLETTVCRELVVVLDACFAHRVRALEGKDGNPLNEVRMLAASILAHDGVLASSSPIRYRPDRAVLGIDIGEPIRIDRKAFERLADAYFAETVARYT